MNERLQTYYGATGVSSEQRNKVLRNTYWMLALSLVPTVLGAWLGVALHFGPGVTMIAMLVAFGLIFAVSALRNSTAGVFALLAFTFAMGVGLSNLLQWTLRFSNGPELIMTAFGGTAAVFVAMASLATVVKRDLGGLQKFLFVGLIIMIVAGLINIFMHSTAVMLALNVAAMGVFSAFLVVDVKRVLDGGETNYLTATLSIYLDLINIFTALLQLLGIFGGRRD